ncbi:hypothetical protein EMGBS15_11230 [Filimonas sp.]|nr:hypothetical protein EMGBS15_11230 [Filimonas sp.]
MHDQKMKRIRLQGVILPCIFLAAMVLYLFPPERNPYYPKCIFKQLTTFECAGCGSARSLHALLHGHVSLAADYNLLLMVLLPVLIVGGIASYSNYLDNVWPVLNRPKIYLILIILFWIMRNIDHFPFTFLHSDK